MFEVYIVNPYASSLCVTTFLRGLTSLSVGPTRVYGLHIVTTRANSKRRKRLRREWALVISPCPASSTRCHPKHGLASGPQRAVHIAECTADALAEGAD